MSAPASAPEVITMGCRLNTFESEVIRDHATQAGLHDAIILNTCAVTAEAERQARAKAGIFNRASKSLPRTRSISGTPASSATAGTILIRVSQCTTSSISSKIAAGSAPAMYC